MSNNVKEGLQAIKEKELPTFAVLDFYKHFKNEIPVEAKEYFLTLLTSNLDQANTSAYYWVTESLKHLYTLECLWLLLGSKIFGIVTKEEQN